MSERAADGQPRKGKVFSVEHNQPWRLPPPPTCRTSPSQVQVIVFGTRRDLRMPVMVQAEQDGPRQERRSEGPAVRVPLSRVRGRGLLHNIANLLLSQGGLVFAQRPRSEGAETAAC